MEDNIFLREVINNYKHEYDLAVKWLRDNPNAKSIASSTNIKKIFYGYGGKSCSCSEYHITINSKDMLVEVNKDEKHFSYSQLRDFIKGTMEAPTTEKDIAQKTAAQLPDMQNAKDTAPVAFDYSALDEKTGSQLRCCEQAIRQQTAGYFTLLGEKLKEAQDLLADHGNGTFEKWYSAMGFKRQTVYNLIQRYEFMSSPTIGEHTEEFEKLPLTLSYAVSDPKAPQELVEKILDGDITTHKDYIALKKELEEVQKQIEANKSTMQNMSASFNRVADASKKNYEWWTEEQKKSRKLEQEIKELSKLEEKMRII